MKFKRTEESCHEHFRKICKMYVNECLDKQYTIDNIPYVFNGDNEVDVMLTLHPKYDELNKVIIPSAYFYNWYKWRNEEFIPSRRAHIFKLFKETPMSAEEQRKILSVVKIDLY